MKAQRPGLTLLETIIATALFVISATLLGQLLQLGLRANDQNRLTTRALLLAESKLEELIIGVLAAETTLEPARDDLHQDLAWTLYVQPMSTPGLYRAVVRVYQVPLPELGDENAPRPQERIDLEEAAVELVALERWLFRLPDPEAGPGGSGGPGRPPPTIPEMLGLPPNGPAGK